MSLKLAFRDGIFTNMSKSKLLNNFEKKNLIKLLDLCYSNIETHNSYRLKDFDFFLSPKKLIHIYTSQNIL